MHTAIVWTLRRTKQRSPPKLSLQHQGRQSRATYVEENDFLEIPAGKAVEADVGCRREEQNMLTKFYRSPMIALLSLCLYDSVSYP